MLTDAELKALVAAGKRLRRSTEVYEWHTGTYLVSGDALDSIYQAIEPFARVLQGRHDAEGN